jgi:TRAP-type uncharacterized transport system substrate-binding protein
MAKKASAKRTPARKPAIRKRGPAKPPQPRLERSLTLHFQGDWGGANLHRVCGWLAQELGDRTGAHSRFAIWNGAGGIDSVRAIGRGLVDVALTTPGAFARMALNGRGPYVAESFPHLRGLGTVPQRDRLVLAIDARHNIHSFADLRKRRPPIRIAASPDDGASHIGFATHRLMEAAGIPREMLESWGGGYVEAIRPDECIELVKSGAADAIFHEAIMTYWWQELADNHDLTYVPVERPVLRQLERNYGWPSATLPAGYLRGMSKPLETLDFSDFLLIVRDDMPDDVAELLAYCLVETSAALEVQYKHIPPERSPVTYPLTKATLAHTAIPLHPAAERYYKSRRYI